MRRLVGTIAVALAGLFTHAAVTWGLRRIYHQARWGTL